MPWDGEVAEDDEGEGGELPDSTEELGAGRRRGGVYDEEEPMDESGDDDDDAASEAESFSQQSTQQSQSVPVAAANAFRSKRKRA